MNILDITYYGHLNTGWHLKQGLNFFALLGIFFLVEIASVPQWPCSLQGCSFQNLKCRCLLHCTRPSKHPRHHGDRFDGPHGQLRNPETTDQTCCCSVQGKFANPLAPQGLWCVDQPGAHPCIRRRPLHTASAGCFHPCYCD